MTNPEGMFGVRSDQSLLEDPEGVVSCAHFFQELQVTCKEDAFWSRGQWPELPPRCGHCRSWIGHTDTEQHMKHILNGCKSFQQQGRYAWRHDAVLSYVAANLDQSQDGLRWHCHLPGYRTHEGGTVPDQLIVTKLTPDICIVDHRQDRPSVVIVELTITWDDRLDAARQEKSVQFHELTSTLSRQFPVQFLSLQVGAFRQKLSDTSRYMLKSLYNYTLQQVPFEVFEEHILSITELCSYKIFLERHSTDWDAELPYPKPPDYTSLQSPTPVTTEPEAGMAPDVMADDSVVSSDSRSPSASSSVENCSRSLTEHCKQGDDHPEDPSMTDELLGGGGDAAVQHHCGDAAPGKGHEDEAFANKGANDNPAENIAMEDHLAVQPQPFAVLSVQSVCFACTMASVASVVFIIWTYLHIFIPILLLVSALLRFYGKA